MPNQTSSEAVDRLQDQLLLAKLINSYHWCADHFDWVGWADSFTEDAEFEFAGGFGVMKGRQQIHDICKGNMDHVYDTMQHIMVNLDFEITGPDSATGHGNLIFSALPDATKPNQYYQSGGRYRWQFRRTPGGWKISRAHLEFLWNNGSDADQVFVGKDQR